MEKVTREEVERVFLKNFSIIDEATLKKSLEELFPPESYSVNYKLKHLSRFCCKPANELEFEAVKMAAKIGGVDIDDELSLEDLKEYPYLTVNYNEGFGGHLMSYHIEEGLLSVYEFTKKLRMSKEQARELEDDRVAMKTSNYHKCWKWSSDDKTLIALNGHYFKLSEDKTEVTLHKR